MPEVDKSEKITINVGLVDLGQIDLLVDEGFYANRTDFIRTAPRRLARKPGGGGERHGGAPGAGTRHTSPEPR